MSTSESSKKKSPLTEAAKARVERNRLRALHIRQAKLTTQSYLKPDAKELFDNAVVKIHGKQFIDSGAGFLIEKSTIEKIDAEKSSAPGSRSSSSGVVGAAQQFSTVNDKKIAIPINYEECLECGDKFVESYLHGNFDYSVCDNCRDPDDKHTLITRTQAKEDYLLKDCDLDRREPILKFISRKNPHNIRWGDMKLYLQLQIEKRALEVWGSTEELEKQREERSEKRIASKTKKYNKQLKQLRMNVRSSLYDKTIAAGHIHEFGPETYNENDDTYSRSCLTCQYSESFEKM